MASFKRRKTSTGETRWDVRVRLKGMASAACASFATKSAARAWAEQITADHRSRKLLPRIEAASHTLADACERYLEEIAPRRLNDVGCRKRRAHLQFWCDELGSVTLADLTPALITQARGKLDVSGPTTNRYLAALSSVLDYCSREWEWLEVNPCQRVRRMPESRGRVRFLSDAEREALLAECPPALLAWVLAALSSGARWGELDGLRLGDVDGQRAVLHDTKNSQRRVITFSDRAAAAIAALPRRMDGRLLPPFPRRDWKAALAAAKVEDFRFHDLRHTAASYLAMSGASVPEIAAFLGHKSFAMSSRYAHLTSEHSAQRADAMAERFGV